MTPVNGAEPTTLDEAGSVWRDCLDQGPETITPTSLPGLVASLTRKGLATTNGESVGLTPAGFAAYQSVAAEAPTAENATAEAKPQIREGTKQATLIAMLRRPDGADLDEIAEATGWKKHSIRGAISGALKKKLGLRSPRPRMVRDGASTEPSPPEPDPRPHLHQPRRVRPVGLRLVAGPGGRGRTSGTSTMPTIRLSDATYRDLADLAILPFASTGVRQPDGSWLVPLEDDTMERLQQQRLPGETDDDLVARVIRIYRGQRPS